MDNFPELLQLYDITNLPEKIRKEYELRRWRTIMEKARYEQDDLPGYLDAEAKARESDISYATYFRHKRSVALRWFKYYRACKDENKKMKLLHQYNMIARMR